jgi:chromosome segregation ATPase
VSRLAIEQRQTEVVNLEDQLAQAKCVSFPPSSCPLYLGLTAAPLSSSALKSLRNEISATAADSTAHISSLETELSTARNEIITLRDTLVEHEQQSLTSSDSEEINELKNRLAVSEEELEDLRTRLEDAQSLEWGAKDAVKVAEDENATLGERVSQLEGVVEEEKGFTVEAKAAVVLLEDTVAGLRQELDTTNGQLSVETRARQDAEHEREVLLAEVNDLELSLSRFETLENELVAVTTELDNLRATSEDEGFAALQEVTVRFPPLPIFSTFI